MKRGAVPEFERSSKKVPLGRVCDSKTESDKVLVVGDHGMLVGAKEWFLIALDSLSTPPGFWPDFTMTGWR